MKIITNYWKPTPKKWRKIGDALLAVTLFAAPYELVTQNHYLGMTFLIVGIVGKFLTNFFSENNNV